MRFRTWSVAAGVVRARLSASAARKSKPESTPTPALSPPLCASQWVADDEGRCDATGADRPGSGGARFCTVLENARSSTRISLRPSDAQHVAVAEVDAINGAIRSSGLGSASALASRAIATTGSDGYNIALSDRREDILDRLVTLDDQSRTEDGSVGKQKPLDPGRASRRTRRIAG